jgi:two-component sensor histidine kinase
MIAAVARRNRFEAMSGLPSRRGKCRRFRMFRQVGNRLRAIGDRAARSGRASGSRLLFAMLGLLVLLLLFWAISNFSQEGGTRDIIIAESDVLRTLSAANESGLSAESAQRGYVLTRDPAYLEPYRAASARWPRLLRDVRATDPLLDAGRTDLLDRMERLQRAKMRELDRTIALFERGDEEGALAQVRDNLGRTLMQDYLATTDEYRRLVADSIAEDRLILDLAETQPYRLLVALFGFIFALLILGYVLERRRALAEFRLRRNKEVTAAHEQTALLARELNHRVNNLFSVILAILSLAARRHRDVDTLVADLRERIQALSRAHSVTQGRADVATVSMVELIRTSLEPYFDAQSDRVRLDAADIELSARNITPLGLILHELATNAVKYGAIGNPRGRLVITVEKIEKGGTPNALICWTEHGERPDLSEKGFGSTMMQAAARQMDGDVEVEALHDGIEARLTFPLSRDGSQ